MNQDQDKELKHVDFSSYSLEDFLSLKQGREQAVPVTFCIHCHKSIEETPTQALFQCAKCCDPLTLYCGKVCQKADYQRHKLECQKSPKGTHLSEELVTIIESVKAAMKRDMRKKMTEEERHSLVMAFTGHSSFKVSPTDMRDRGWEMAEEDDEQTVARNKAQAERDAHRNPNKKMKDRPKKE